jgi:hypothetical protein
MRNGTNVPGWIVVGVGTWFMRARRNQKMDSFVTFVSYS